MRRQKMITENPVESAEIIKIDEKPIDYFTDKEIETFRGGCTNLRYRAIVEGLRSTGLRAGEFEQININDVDWNTGDVWVNREKGGTNTPAYFDKVAVWHIKAYLNMRSDNNPALFVGHRMPNKRMEKIAKSYAKKTPETLREVRRRTA